MDSLKSHTTPNDEHNSNQLVLRIKIQKSLFGCAGARSYVEEIQSNVMETRQELPNPEIPCTCQQRSINVDCTRIGNTENEQSVAEDSAKQHVELLRHPESSPLSSCPSQQYLDVVSTVPKPLNFRPTMTPPEVKDWSFLQPTPISAPFVFFSGPSLGLQQQLQLQHLILFQQHFQQHLQQQQQLEELTVFSPLSHHPKSAFIPFCTSPLTTTTCSYALENKQ